MALKKALTSSNGIVTEHHVISGIQYSYAGADITANVTVTSYVDKSYRTAEQDSLVSEAQIASVREQLDELVNNPTDENEAERQELSQQLTDLFLATQNAGNVGQYSVLQREYRNVPLDEETGISRTQVYQALKELPDFTGATDA